ncbi:MAG: choice-of-anchor J domain-containing protein [Oceanipulchritudo sp.]
MDRAYRSLPILGSLLFLAAAPLLGVQINEIRVDEPGGTDSNEFIELKGNPGESLDGYWYLSVGDHTSFDNPKGFNDPDKGGGVVEFAISLDGFSIGDDGLFLISTTGLQIDVFGLGVTDVDFLLTEMNFENSDNVTHILVKGYTGIEVTNFADQYDDFAVDIDDNDDGILNATLPWTEVVDAVGVVYTPNDSDPEEFVYGVALGFEDVGPQGSFAPGMIFRGSDDGEWNIGNFNLINSTGDGLFEGDPFNGPALDTPGAPNPATLTIPRLFSVNPLTARDGQVVTLRGDNLTGATEVTVGGESVPFTVVDDAIIEIVASDTWAGGIVTVTTPNGSSAVEDPLEVLVFEKEVLFFEDFEAGLGDFLTVSLASNRDWRQDSYAGDFFAEMSGFGGDAASDDWLITPEIDLSGATEPTLSFVTARNYGGPELEILISTDFDGLNPSTATWDTITAPLSQGGYEEVDSGEIDLSAYIGETIVVAFHYTSTGPADGQGATYQVDDVLVTDAIQVISGYLVEDFETDLGNFAVISVASNLDWEFGEFGGNGFAEMSGFGADEASDDWLISPAVDLSEAVYPILNFITARRFGGPELEVLISADYDGVDPAAATWYPIEAPLSQDNYDLVSSGDIGLSPYIGQTVYIAFRYTSIGTESGDGAVYQIHEVTVLEGTEEPVEPGWVDDLSLSHIYRYSPQWAYSETMGFLNIAAFPWVYQNEFGYFYFVGGDAASAAWIFLNDQYAWMSEAYPGFFIFSDGTYDNFLNPQD